MTSNRVPIHAPHSVAHWPRNGPQPKKNDSKSVLNAAAAQGSALATKLVVTVFNHPDHLRVDRWDLFDDRGRVTVRLPSPRDLVNECRDRWLTVSLLQDPEIPELVKKAHNGCYHVFDHALLSDHRRVHGRLSVNSGQDGKCGAGLRAAAVSKNMWSGSLESSSCSCLGGGSGGPPMQNLCRSGRTSCVERSVSSCVPSEHRGQG